MAGSNKHKPRSLQKRQELFDQNLRGKQGYKRPGSNKK